MFEMNAVIFRYLTSVKKLTKRQNMPDRHTISLHSDITKRTFETLHLTECLINVSHVADYRKESIYCGRVRQSRCGMKYDTH